MEKINITIKEWTDSMNNVYFSAVASYNELVIKTNFEYGYNAENTMKHRLMEAAKSDCYFWSQFSKDKQTQITVLKVVKREMMVFGK